MLTTAVRFVDMIYLLSRESTNLPVSVIIVTSAMILFGVALVAKKFINNIRVRHLMAFYIVQAGMVVFNLVNVAIFCLLQLSVAETFIVGSFLDILIDFCAIYACLKHMRSAYRPFVRVVGKGQAQ
jgi:hypothetical protein